MNAELLARKLHPLRPRAVERWLRARALAPPELRELIDQQIVHTAQHVLGDVANQPLLSLPPERVIQGPLHLGTVLYAGGRGECGLRVEEILQNLAIFGRSGAGKTNVVLHLIRQFSQRRIPFLFLDWKRTARHLLPHLNGRVHVYTPGRSIAPLAFNPFVPPQGLEPETYANQVVDLLAAAYTLGDGASSLVQKCLRDLYAGDLAASPARLLERLNREPLKGRALGWQVSARRALESLVLARLSREDPATQVDLVAELIHGPTIVELDALNHNAKRFLVPALLLWIFYVQMANRHREQLALVIVIEEAHHLLYRSERRSQETVMNMLLRQCRELGIGVIVVDQHPHLISSAALGNTFATICLNLKEPSDVNKAAALTSLSDDDRPWLGRLPVGQGVVKLQDRWREPFLVRFPRVEVDKGAVDDRALRAYIDRQNADSGGHGRIGGNVGQVQQIRLDDDPLDEQSLVFLEDVLLHADDGVKARYARLGMSGGRGQALKQRLLTTGWLEAQRIPVGNSRKVLLRLTPLARAGLGLGQPASPRESLAHSYWKRYYARQFSAEGYAVTLEAQRRNGRVDVLATRNGRRVAIEIETGRSNVVENVKNDLRSGFAQIIIVVADPRRLDRIEAALARHELLLRGRVFILRAGHPLPRASAARRAPSNPR